MSNQLAVRPKASITELMSVADAFHKSGLFTDVKDAAQAMVKIMAGEEFGIEPFSAMSGIHIIKGKPSIGSGLMASSVKASGKYNYVVKRLDNESCILHFYESGKFSGESKFTIQDAKTAETQNLHKFPRNMLFARAISNGIRWFAPDVFRQPVYTPEELNGGIPDDPAPFEDVPHTDMGPTTPATQAEEPEPPMQAHPEKKMITDNAFGKAIDRLQKGELELIEKLDATYALTPKQAAILDNYRPVQADAEATADDDANSPF
jgi:hypothetical protein